MVLHGPAGAQLDAGLLRARIERVAGSGRYRMLTGEAETLVTEPAGSSVALKIRCGGRPYEAGFDLLRNAAAAGPARGGETARLTGGVFTRRYEALFDVEDGCSLPITLFLLYHTVTLRRRAFLTGPAKNREADGLRRGGSRTTPTQANRPYASRSRTAAGANPRG
jgi:hypothetical protein